MSAAGPFDSEQLRHFQALAQALIELTPEELNGTVGRIEHRAGYRPIWRATATSSSS